MTFIMKYKGFPKETKYLDDKTNPKKKPGYNGETNYDPIIETEKEVKKANALEDANQE
jgi:hypothetical protein|tara:strand:- start:1570 stop:1743 length:174 start_codon:yes stop_codon:yes gene_type:complete